MTFETPPFPLGFPCTSMGVGRGGGVADITWNGPFCVDRKAEYGAHTQTSCEKKGASFETYSNFNNELDF